METFPTGGAWCAIVVSEQTPAVQIVGGLSFDGPVSVDTSSREPAPKASGAMTRVGGWELEACGMVGRTGPLDAAK